MSALRQQPRSGDVVAVSELLAATGFFSPAEVEIGAELVEEALNRGSAAGYHFLFEDAEGPLAVGKSRGLLGYCCFGEIPLTVGSFDLYWIAVSPQRQGTGHGTALLRAAEREMERLGARRVFVDTSGRAQYQPTRAFYQARGYTVAARLTDFYAPGDDKVVYTCSLGEPGRTAEQGGPSGHR
jgi:GNAT superfamily N-acetyltransferase